MEMPPIVNVISRLSTISEPTPVESGLTPRRYMITAAAPRSPNTAPDAPPCRPIGLQQQRAGRSAEQRGEVQQRETHASEGRFEHLTELEQQEHVEREVDHPVVEESRRDQPVPLIGDVDELDRAGGRPNDHPLRQRQVGSFRSDRAARVQVLGVLDDHPHEHGSVDGHQRIGDEDRLAGAPVARPRGGRRTTSLGTLDALAADVGAHEAFIACRPATPRAAPSRLAIGMAIADGAFDGRRLRKSCRRGERHCRQARSYVPVNVALLAVAASTAASRSLVGDSAGSSVAWSRTCNVNW